jgi:hypothetical protein
LISQIEAAWEKRPDKADHDRNKANGPHWALRVVGYNPISGYRVECTRV